MRNFRHRYLLETANSVIKNVTANLAFEGKIGISAPFWYSDSIITLFLIVTTLHEKPSNFWCRKWRVSVVQHLAKCYCSILRGCTHDVRGSDILPSIYLACTLSHTFELNVCSGINILVLILGLI